MALRLLNSREHTPQTMDEEGTRKFEAFLDRNCRGWRENEQFAEDNAGSIERNWALGIDDVERTALYRGLYVEIRDDSFVRNEVDRDFEVDTTKQIICDIDGDLTPVAQWVR